MSDLNQLIKAWKETNASEVRTEIAEKLLSIKKYGGIKSGPVCCH